MQVLPIIICVIAMCLPGIVVLAAHWFTKRAGSSGLAPGARVVFVSLWVLALACYIGAGVGFGVGGDPYKLGIISYWLFGGGMNFLILCCFPAVLDPPESQPTT